MDFKVVQNTAQDVEKLFKTVMGIYWQYLNQLETMIAHVSPDQVDFLKILTDHVAAVQSALEHDIAVFQEALQNDFQELRALQDQLQIDSLHEQLNI